MLDFKPLFSNNENHDIYTNLDSIIDTRLGLIYKLNRKLFNEIITTSLNSYQARAMDDFNGFDSEIFKELYKNRNKSIIKDPIPTYVPQLIKSYILSALEQDPEELITIHLNVYPYDFNKEETEKLRSGIYHIFKGLVNVEILNKPEVDITVKFIHETIGIMIMYNGIAWIDHNLANKNLMSLNLPDILMVVPRLADRTIVKKDSLNDFFKDFEKFMHPFIQLLFLSPRIFSIKIDKK